MIQAYEGRVKITGLQFRKGNRVDNMSIVITSEQEEATVDVTIGRKKNTIKVDRRTGEKLCSCIRRMLYDAGRVRGIIQRP